MLAYKDLGEDDYEEWAGRRLQASLAQDSREDRLASVYEEMENDMMVRDGPRRGREGGEGTCLGLMAATLALSQLLGATAIEDKLQQGVPETIALLTLANIKIWVLTGDKQGERPAGRGRGAESVPPRSGAC